MSSKANTTVLVNPQGLLVVGVLGLILTIHPISYFKKYDVQCYFLSKRFEEHFSEEPVDIIAEEKGTDLKNC